MMKSVVIGVLLTLCIASSLAQFNDICASPTIVEFAEGDVAGLRLISNGDVHLVPGSFSRAVSNDISSVRTTFVNQRQGALKFHTQVGVGEDERLCLGLLNYGTIGGWESLFVVREESDGTLNYYDLINDEFYFEDKKRSVSPFFYTIDEVAVSEEDGTFSLNGDKKYFFSGSNVIACLDDSCRNTQVIQVEGKITDAIESPEFLLVLSVTSGNLVLSKIQSYDVVSVKKIELQDNRVTDWSFVSINSFIGVISGDLTIISLDGTSTVIDTVGDATVKVDLEKIIAHVSVQSQESIINYVCKNAQCKKIAKTSAISEIWDFDVNVMKTAFAFAEGNEITVVTCDRFDCKEPEINTIAVTGIVSDVQVGAFAKPVIAFSLQNGASGLLNCLDETCSSASLTRLSDYVASPNVAFIRGDAEFVVFANGYIQSFNNVNASPKGELCRKAITGNSVVVDGEVFICNRLPANENYADVYFWTPVVSSIFAQNA